MNTGIKKLLQIATCLLLTITILTGCTNTNEENSDNLKVMTTIFPPYDFVREITQGEVDLTMLVPAGSETHHYDPTPQDIIAIQECDVFIYVGGESDEWVDSILNTIDTTNITVISLMDLVEVYEEEVVEGMENEDNHNHQADDNHDHDHKDEDKYDHSHDGDEVEYDEHIWTSIRNAITITKAINQTLIKLDENNAEIYQKNTDEYISKLTELDTSFQEVVNQGARKTLVFGDRFPFRYFVEDYGLTYYAAFPGCSSLSEASAATIAFLIDKVNDEEIPVVFHIEFSNENIANIIAESTNATKLLFNSAHTISKDDFEAGITYIEIMHQNLENLKEALK